MDAGVDGWIHKRMKLSLTCFDRSFVVLEHDHGQSQHSMTTSQYYQIMQQA